MQTEVNIAILAHTHRVLFVPSHHLSPRVRVQDRRPLVVAPPRVVIIHLLYVKPLYRQWFKDSFALWDRHHFTVLLVLLLL